VDKKAFVEEFSGRLQDNPNYGGIQAMEWNGLVNFDVDARTNDRIAGSVAIITVKGKSEGVEHEGKDRRDIRFRKDGGTWQIDDLPEFFPPPPPTPSPSGMSIQPGRG
jgi:hypothetical protein